MKNKYYQPMKFTIQKNIILENPETKPFLADTFVPDNKEKLPLVIFCHGYKRYIVTGKQIGRAHV